MFGFEQHSVSKLFVIGSDVWSCRDSQGYVQMWSRSQFIEKFGREFDGTLDFIAVMNGDASTQAYATVAGSYCDNGTIGYYLTGHETGNIRLTYLLALHQ